MKYEVSDNIVGCTDKSEKKLYFILYLTYTVFSKSARIKH